MKAISIIVCFCIVAFAQNEQYQQTPPQQQQYDSEQQKEKVQKLIKKVIIKKKNKKKNKKKTTKDWTELVQEESLYLSLADREYLYEKNMKKAAEGWAALNVFPGFGLGSYIQGDVASGVRQSVIDGVGLAILYFALLFTLPMVGDDDDYKCDYRCHYSQAKIVFNSAYAVSIAGRISGLIFPFVHQEKYNKVLKTALNINDISYSIAPLIVPKNEGVPALGLKAQLLF